MSLIAKLNCDIKNLSRDSAEVDLPHILSHLCTSHIATPGDSQTVEQDNKAISNALSHAKSLQWTHERAVIMQTAAQERKMKCLL